MHESICFDRRYYEQAARIGTLRADIMRIVREQEHRFQGIDATFSNNEHIIRITDSTLKTRRYVDEHLRLSPTCVAHQGAQ
jgi:hypothetical protein